jgi:hypothetical protein
LVASAKTSWLSGTCRTKLFPNFSF